MAPIWSTDPAVQSYIFYSCVLALKMMCLTLLTSCTRYRKKVFANEEDAKIAKGKVKFGDPDVERIRRAHLNDLENIPTFWVLGALYLTTGPAAAWATMLFRWYTVGRVLHTFVYAIKTLPQPTRAISFFMSFFITIYMGVHVILHYANAL